MIPCESNPCFLFLQSIISTDTKQNEAIYFFNSDILFKSRLLHTVRNLLLFLSQADSFRRRFNYFTEQNCLVAKRFSNHRLGEFYIHLSLENEKSVTDLSLKCNLLTVFFFSTLIEQYSFSISLITFPFCASQRTHRKS